jgi:hypothetical protein
MSRFNQSLDKSSVYFVEEEQFERFEVSKFISYMVSKSEMEFTCPTCSEICRLSKIYLQKPTIYSS